MSSFLERQQQSFADGLASQASKLTGPTSKRLQAAPPSPSPSITSTASAAAGATPTKKERNDGPKIVHSQPAITSTGQTALSQITYTINWLKEKDEPKTLQEILEYVSIQNKSEAEQEKFAGYVRNSSHIQWIPDPNLTEQTWRTGTYIHRPTIPNVKTKTQLLAYLQKRTDASGVQVKDLKDGWPSCEAAIDELEKDHRVLVIRWKKDNHPKTVWLDDPSLFHAVDPEFKILWGKVEVPALDMIHQRLLQVGQKPTSDDPRAKLLGGPKVEKKKKRATRRAGKATNTHMEHLLKDYSHLKR